MDSFDIKILVFRLKWAKKCPDQLTLICQRGNILGVFEIDLQAMIQVKNLYKNLAHAESSEHKI